MATNGVLILECLDKRDPGSEGLFLSHMFDLMKVANQYMEVRTKQQFLNLLLSSPYKFIHITTHGSVIDGKKGERFCGFNFPDGEVTSNDLFFLKGKLKGNIIVSTACLSGDKKFSRQFIAITGCKYYIAPSGGPLYHNSIFFAHIFYHKHFILKKDVAEILHQYDKRFKNPHEFTAASFIRNALAGKNHTR
jgi:hypothetical protein